MLTVNVLFFAGARQRSGTARVQLELQEPITVREAAQAACQAAPNQHKLPDNIAFAINNSYALPDQIVNDGDEIAILPPVSGGAQRRTEPLVLITSDPIDTEKVASNVASDTDGAVVIFNGITRNKNQGRLVIKLEYEAYSPMAEETMQQIIDEMHDQWDIGAVAVAHRTGIVEIGQVSMCLAVSAPHRADAFKAAQYFVDELKQRVPIWKKEHFVGGEVWINDTPG